MAEGHQATLSQDFFAQTNKAVEKELDRLPQFSGLQGYCVLRYHGMAPLTRRVGQFQKEADVLTGGGCIIPRNDQVGFTDFVYLYKADTHIAQATDYVKLRVPQFLGGERKTTISYLANLMCSVINWGRE